MGMIWNVMDFMETLWVKIPRQEVGYPLLYHMYENAKIGLSLVWDGKKKLQQ